MNETTVKENNAYSVSIRVFEKEIFAIEISASNPSNRMMAIGLVSIFCIMTVVGAYGDKFISLYHSFVG